MIFSDLTGAIITDELMAEERLAFAWCDFDRMEGLSWLEVKTCEERFAEVLAAKDIAVPTEDDFKAADLNGDGVLMFKEWEQWIEEKN